MQCPYQIIYFPDQVPEIGEYIYEGESGWYPQVALKRRFGLRGITEEEFIERLQEFIANREPFQLKLTEETKPEFMPVKVVEVEPTEALLDFHNSLINDFSKIIASKHPEREGENYFPHMTIEWHGEYVVEPEKFENTNFLVDKVYLVKDHNKDSRPQKALNLK